MNVHRVWMSYFIHKISDCYESRVESGHWPEQTEASSGCGAVTAWCLPRSSAGQAEEKRRGERARARLRLEGAAGGERRPSLTKSCTTDSLVSVGTFETSAGGRAGGRSSKEEVDSQRTWKVRSCICA